MVSFSQILADHPRLEKIVYLSLVFLFLISAYLNIKCSLAIYSCQTTSDFLGLFDNVWANRVLLTKIVFSFMEYYYTRINPFFILLSCFTIIDIYMIFISVIELLQIGENSGMILRQRVLLSTIVLKIIGLGFFLVQIYLAVHSLTTGAAFAHLRLGALIYGITNGFTFFPLLVGCILIGIQKS